MLTKDLLNYRIRNDKISPSLVDPREPGLLQVARDMVALFADSSGKTLAELEELMDEAPWSVHPRRAALAKLLTDRCDEEDDDGAVAAQRWNVLKAAEEQRGRKAFGTSAAAFAESLALSLQKDPATLKDELYADLPEYRRLKDFAKIEPEALLHRLNCAEVQGLLLHAQEVRLTLVCSLVERRRFFRLLKFQQLLAEVEEDDGALSVSLSGPLRIFQNSQSYGLRLANFFPYVLQLPRWELTAAIKLNGRELSLALDHRAGIKSHYREHTPYLPKELTAFIASFNARSSDWQAELGDDYLHLGRQSYCFPDVSFKAKDGRVYHIELFHRWHKGQLAQRLAALAASDNQTLLLGVADEVYKDAKVQESLTQSACFAKRGLVFKNFPTPKALLGLLPKL